jgi:homocysteine S-methyltransferase
MTAACASPAYDRVAAAIAGDRCVVLDGGVGTELAGRSGREEGEWAAEVLVDDPVAVLDVHRRYVDAGCDVISTNTWGLAAAAGAVARDALVDETGAPVHWIDVAHQALRLAHRAVQEGGRDGDCAVAFSLNADLDTPQAAETIRLLARAFEDAPPHLILLETLSVVRDTTFATVEALVETGTPVWLGFRRCRHGLCGVYGQHWGGPEGDAFGRAARRFESLGASALLINCVPPDHVAGMVPWLRDFTDLPLGVYPNLGYLSAAGWRDDRDLGAADFADLALRWRGEGAQIVGGCCGVGPEHVSAARASLEGVPAGRPTRRRPPLSRGVSRRRDARPWTDRRERPLHPLPFPQLAVDAGVHAPDEPSFVLWKHLFRERVGAHQRCLDVGCGTGILAVQLALNDAAHVHAIDIDPRAVANTLANAFRNGVDTRLTAAELDVYPWVPEERYDVIVANLSQLPENPLRAEHASRLVDYWGSNQLEQLIAKLGHALAADGAAYVVALSILPQDRIAAMLDDAGFSCEVVDFTLFDFPREYAERLEHIATIEERSDAYHLVLGDRDVMAGYLLEVRPDTGGDHAPH